MIDELNPKNEALTQLREHWQLMLMLVMKKHGIKSVTIDVEDISWITAANERGETPIIVTEGRKRLGPDKGFTLHLCETQKEAIEIVAKFQGQG